jgi:nucleoid DNA-binding protein
MPGCPPVFGRSRCYSGIGMKKQDIAKRIARQSGVSRAAAADRVDGVVNQILADMRRGRKTNLPGLGTFSRDGDGRARFERDGGGDDSSQD